MLGSVEPAESAHDPDPTTKVTPPVESVAPLVEQARVVDAASQIEPSSIVEPARMVDAVSAVSAETPRPGSVTVVPVMVKSWRDPRRLAVPLAVVLTVGASLVAIIALWPSRSAPPEPSSDPAQQAAPADEDTEEEADEPPIALSAPSASASAAPAPVAPRTKSKPPPSKQTKEELQDKVWGFE
jgi:hypothetical protein